MRLDGGEDGISLGHGQRSSIIVKAARWRAERPAKKKPRLSAGLFSHTHFLHGA